MQRSIRSPLALALLMLHLAACTAPRASAPAPAPVPTQPPLVNDAMSAVTRVSEPGTYGTPFDATPSPDGALVYFTAEGDGGGMLLRVSPGSAPEPLAQGAPLVAPRGLDVSGDGGTLYVADEAAASEIGAGQVFALPAEGGTLAALPEAAGYRPRALTVALEAGAEVLYVTGSHPDDGRPVLLRVPLDGAKGSIVAAGAPMVEPSGVATARDGTLYVADRSAAGEGRGSLFRLRGATLEQLASGFLTGGPVVGVALTGDEQTLLVSSLEEQARGAQALIVDLATLAQARFDKVIGANSGAGGLQRAANADVYAWADSTAGPPRRGSGGGIYTLVP
jgi:DNA-binding beta-propeller fold protein YncE